MKRPSHAAAVAYLKAYLARSEGKDDEAVMRAVTIGIYLHNRAVAE